MAFNLNRQVYESLPLWIKRSVCLVPFSWLAGKKYRAVYQRGERYEKADRSMLLGSQEAALGVMLQWAVAEVPAYRYLSSVVHRLKPFEALKAFPLLDKDTV